MHSKYFCKRILLNGASSNLIKSLAFSNMHYFHISPTICTVLDALSLPITLTAVHVYRVLPFSLVFLIRSELSVPIVYMSPWEIFCPFFVQVAVGVGTPLAWHWIVMLVLVSAVTLLPILIVTGFWFWSSTVVGFAGIFTFGLEGPV